MDKQVWTIVHRGPDARVAAKIRDQYMKKGYLPVGRGSDKEVKMRKVGTAGAREFEVRIREN